MRPKVYIAYAPGNNCQHETALAFKLAGADPEICQLTDDFIRHKKRLTECDILAVPGGFSFGDHLAAGRIFAIDLNHRLRDALMEVHEKQIPIIGICNGFQVLVNTGLLPGDGKVAEPTALLDRNNSAVFESRRVTLIGQKSDCIWTRGLEGKPLRMPVAHGEGRLLVSENFDDAQTVFRYDGSDYPANPNGSPSDRAGICDPSGHVLGMMPHPERAVYPWLGSDDGLEIFRQGVQAVAG